jgi:hypothetical protein
MRIEQIPHGSSIFSKEYWDKWHCVRWAMGRDEELVHRYLQEDGTWGQFVHHFDSKEEVDQALAKDCKPDFTLTEEELQWRQTARQDMLAAWHDLDELDDYYDGLCSQEPEEHDFP